MKCCQCGKNIEDIASFCPYCGTSQIFTSDLIQKAIGGNQDAIAELYNRTYNNVYHTIKSMVKDEDTILDILQDSYVKGFQSLDQLDNPANFRAWMKRIAANKAKDWLKRKKPVLFSELADEDSGEELTFEDTKIQNLPEQVIDQQETTRLMNEILDSLSEDQRLVIGMFYYEQMSVREIAETIGCSENTVKSRLNYGRKKIEQQVRQLEKEGTKLYGLAPIPFLLLLFHTNDTYAAELPHTGILRNIQRLQTITDKAITNKAIPNQSASSKPVSNKPASGKPTPGKPTAEKPVLDKPAPGKPIPGRSVGAGAKAVVTQTAGKGLAVKIIAAVVGVSLIGGGVVGGVVLHNKKQESSRLESQSVAPVLDDGANESEQEVSITPEVETQTEQEREDEKRERRDKKKADAYQAILDEYISACKIPDSDYMDMRNNRSQELNSLYPNASGITMFYYHNDYNTSNFYYTYYDIDGNGTEELLIGHGDTNNIAIVDLYGFDDENAVKIIDNPALGDRSSLAVFTDGTLYEHNSSGAASGSDRFSRIAGNGYGNVTIKEYEIDGMTYPDRPYLSSSDQLTEEAYMQMLAQYTEVTDFDWTLLDVDGGTSTQSGNTPSGTFTSDETAELNNFVGSYSLNNAIDLTLYVENQQLNAEIGDDLVMGKSIRTYTDVSFESGNYLICTWEYGCDSYHRNDDGSITLNTLGFSPELDGTYNRK